jgi:hypothetical protein
VTVVELRDIQLPESMQRTMARQAEAEREKRAKIIVAQGEALAAGELADASDVMMAHPLSLQPRQPPDPRRAGNRHELHRRVPCAADEHDRRARRVPGTRRQSRRHALSYPRPHQRSHQWGARALMPPDSH